MCRLAWEQRTPGFLAFKGGKRVAKPLSLGVEKLPLVLRVTLKGPRLQGAEFTPLSEFFSWVHLVFLSRSLTLVSTPIAVSIEKLQFVTMSETIAGL